MKSQSAVATLRAYGYDAEWDGLGNVQARLPQMRSDGTALWRWVVVPTDPTGLVKWLSEQGTCGSRPLAA